MKILVLTDDLVGPVMAGSAVRAWEIARALADAGHVVCLAAADGSERPGGGGPELVDRPPWRWADAIVAAVWNLPPRAFLGRQLLIADGATPLLGVDVWEHSYYIDYRNARPKYLETWFDNLVNWDYVAELYEAAS